jgi:hypothetical protein
LPSSLSGLGTGDDGGELDKPNPWNGTTLLLFVGDLKKKAFIRTSLKGTNKLNHKSNFCMQFANRILKK